ncbi:MAG: heterodisulfide reductase-related iron-sulfur binding cluster [Clostridia bacterium]|nr:heterodisulfide reductase-related iron-sulfur binding cluster [Clostridia bacterium]
MGVLDEVYEALNTCARCGFCHTACKVYKTHLSEVYVPRGRVRLIKAVADGELEIDEAYENAINSCLLCGECAVSCPSGVKAHKLILAARRDLKLKQGLPFSKAVGLKWVFPKPGNLELAFKFFDGFRRTILNRLGGFAEFRGIDVKGLPVASEKFTDQVPEFNAVQNPVKRVAFFVGCMMNHTMDGTGHSVIKVLNSNQCEVIVPKQQVCCGTPMFSYGEFETAKEVARTNILLFENYGVDAVITACASCGSMLKEHYPELFADEPNFLPKVKEFCQKVFDFSEFLLDNFELDTVTLLPNPARVTYHDPCHMVRGQGITEQPRKILKSIPGIQFVEMAEASRCCGASGLFQAYFHDIAKDISAQKVRNIEETNAELVVTSCPACQHRIQGSLRLAGKEQKVVHIADLLAQAYR